MANFPGRLIVWIALALLLRILVLPAPAQSIIFTHLTPGDGLPVGGVTGVTQDLRGFIWFGTENGLVKYDGYEMRSFRRDLGAADVVRLRENTVNALLVDPENRVWFGTDDGLNALHADTSERRHFDTADSDAPPGANVIDVIARNPEGTVWMGGPRGLFELAAGKHAPVQIEERISVTALYWDEKSSQAYVGTRRGEILRVAAGSQNLETVFNGTAAITAIFRDRDDNLWIGTRGSGAVRLRDGVDPLHFTYRAGRTGGLSSNDVRCIYQDSLRQLWIGTRNGLNRFRPDTAKFDRFLHNPEDPRSLPTNDVRSLFEDQRNVLWIGHPRGVSRFSLSQRSFVHHRHRAGDTGSLAHNSVFGMLPDSRGRIWIGTEDGLDVLEKDGLFRHHRIPPDAGLPPSANFVYVIEEAPDEQLWLGTRGGGLIRFDPLTDRLEVYRHDPAFPAGLPNDSITALAVDPKGRLWVGTEDGLTRIDSSGEFLPFEDDPGKPGSLASNAITAIVIDRAGRVFVATGDAGVHVFDEASGTFRFVEKLSSEKIISIFEDDEGRIWVGTAGSGVHAYDPEWKRALHFHNGNSGLPGNTVFGILQDSEGHMWFSTDNGLARANIAEQKFRVFDLDDGIQSMIFHPNAFCRDSGGRLYFGGADGLNVIDPNGLPEARVARQAVLAALEVNGELVKPSPDDPYLQRPLGLTKKLALPFDKTRRLAFRLATLDYTIPAGARFRYRIAPLETEWTEAGSEAKAIYTGLPAGDYTFEAQASLDGAVWNQNSARLAVRIRPPWHRTWWFIVSFTLLCLGTVAGATYSAIQRHAHKIRRRNELLENERNKAEAALSGQLQRAMLVQRTTYELQRTDDSASIFATTLERLVSHFRANGCVLCEYVEKPSPSLVLLAEKFAGLEPPFSFEKISPENPVIANVLAVRPPVYAADLRADSPFNRERSVFLKAGIHAALAIRTSYQGLSNGVLFLLHREPHEWVEDDLRLMETVADQIGVNIAHHRLTLADEKQKAELEAARESAEIANQAKSDFLAKMTHEVRTPLSSILGFSDLLAHDDSIKDEQRETLEIINSCGEHLLQTINDILDMSKIEAGKIELTKEEFDLRELLSGVKGMLKRRAEAKGITLDVECADDVPTWIVTDKIKLRQILVNLVGNAIKFTDKGGITIKAASESYSSGLSPSDKGRPRRLYFEIQDTGTGISEEEVGKLFDKFVQTGSGRRSGQGTGLGLAISKSFVELMGGAIAVRSDFGVGTVFSFDLHCIELPAEVAASKKASAKGMAKLAPGQEEVRVLVAEDQLPNRMLLRTLLEKAGFVVQETSNGQEVVAAWKSFDPHIIFMDNEMPIMNGIEATKEIVRQSDGNPPRIVACTAYALESYRQEAFDAGCVDFLAKPYQQEQLFELIARHVSVEYAGASA